jgi:hypothetical protein
MKDGNTTEGTTTREERFYKACFLSQLEARWTKQTDEWGQLTPAHPTAFCHPSLRNDSSRHGEQTNGERHMHYLVFAVGCIAVVLVVISLCAMTD